MVGIYKITHKTSGMMYIGQSNDIQRRFTEHKTKGATSRIPLDVLIQRYGEDAFSFEVLEECDITQLNERELFWEQYFQSQRYGYNHQDCGETNVIGSKNPNAKLTEQDVEYIRQCYASHQKQRDVYQRFQDKISFCYFQAVWEGRSWSHIMPEVFTEENRTYYRLYNSLGEKGTAAAFTDEEVQYARQRYVNESAKAIYPEFQDRVTYQTFQAMLWGHTYYHLPIYAKKQKCWKQSQPVSTIPGPGK